MKCSAVRPRSPDVACTDQGSNLEVHSDGDAKAGSRIRPTFSAPDATRSFIEQLRADYDYIIVDLSPLAPVVDVRTATSLVDAFVFVVEWGGTKIETVQRALADAPGVAQNMLGVVLNKADTNLLSRYDGHRGHYYYNKYYSRYGYTD